MSASVATTSDSTANSSSWYDFQSLANMRAQAESTPKAATKGVAQQFESVFINMMLTEMRKTVGHSELTGSAASDTYQEMFDQQVSVSMAKAGGIGLASYIQNQLDKVAAARSGSQSGESKPAGMQLPSSKIAAPMSLPALDGNGNTSPGITLPVTPTEFALKQRLNMSGD